VPRALEVLGLLALVVALARPASRVVRDDPHEGIDVLLALDTSSSMATTDLDGARSRMDGARDAATAFVRGRPGDRIGLLTFARYPDLRCPLTRDHDALLRLLAQVRPVASESAEDATGIGTAVTRAAQGLPASAPRARVVVLLTDGEENVAQKGVPGEIAPSQAAQLAQRLGIRVYAVATGRGRPDRSGTFVPGDTRAVEAMARRTGGGFFRAQDADALREVFARIDELERAPFAEPRYAFEDRFLPFLALGLALLLASRALRATALQVLP
jgi:Ca-activated chloride channel family protein